MTSGQLEKDIQEIHDKRDGYHITEISREDLEEKYLRIEKNNECEFIKKRNILSTLFSSKEELISIIDVKENVYVVAQMHYYYI